MSKTPSVRRVPVKKKPRRTPTRAEKLAAECSDLRRQLEASNKTTRQLAEERDDALAEHATLDVKHKNLKQGHRELTSAFERLQAELSSYGKSLASDLRIENEHLRRELCIERERQQQLSARAEELTKENRTLAARLAEQAK